MAGSRFGKSRVYRLPYVFVTLISCCLAVTLVWYASSGIKPTVQIPAPSEPDGSDYENISRFDGYVDDRESHCKWITNVNRSGAVCSAYYDDRENPIQVRVLGYWSLDLDRERFIFCDLANESDRLWTVQAHTTKMTTYIHDKWEYHPTIFHCHLGTEKAHDKNSLPTKVRIHYAHPDYSAEYQKLSSPWLQVHNMKRIAPTNKRQFSVCVQGPLFDDVHSIPMQLMVEFFEMNMILGAEFFTVYLNYPRFDQMDVLQHYVGKGVMELVYWNVKSMLLFYAGQRAAVNDCLYRNMYKAKYLAFMDFDELIIPKLDSNWSSLMKRIDKSEKEAYFSFKNVFFHDKHQPLKEFNERYKLPCSSVSVPRYYEYWHRSKAGLPHIERSKYIAKPLAASNAGIHYVIGLLPGFRVHRVEDDVGLMHHYRLYDIRPDEQTVEDKSMLAYAAELMNALNRTMCTTLNK